MKLSQVVSMPAVVLEFKKKLKLYQLQYLVLPQRSTHHSSDCDETFTSCKHARGGFGNLKNFKIGLAGVPCAALHFDLDEIFHKLMKCCTVDQTHSLSGNSTHAGQSFLTIFSREVNMVIFTYPMTIDSTPSLQAYYQVYCSLYGGEANINPSNIT